MAGLDDCSEWFRDRFRRSIEVGFHYLDLPQYQAVLPELISAFDARVIVENLLRANADSCYIWPLLLNTYFYDAKDTELGHKHAALRGRDIFRELTQEARRAGLAVIAWTNPNFGLTEYAASHPADVMRDRTGEPIKEHICFNSDEFLRLIQARSAAILGDYEVDGIAFDGISYPTYPSLTPCYCEHCERLFRAATGKPLPVEPAWDAAWEKFLEFRYQSSIRFARRLGDHLRQRYPTKLVVFNYHGHVPGYFTEWKTGILPVAHANLSDFTVFEDFDFRLHQHYPSLGAAVLAAERPGRSFQFMTDRFVSSYGCFTMRPAADLAWSVFTAKARGANVTVIDKIRHDFSVEPAVYARIGEVFGELREKEEYFGHPALKEVGLYASVRTRDWYGRDDVSRYDKCVVGAYRALVDAHVQVDFLFDESANLEALGQYPVVFLANTAILTEREVETLTRYVQSGGSILTTWETGLHDALGRRRADFALGGLTGTHYLRHTDEEWNYVRFRDEPWANGLPREHDLPVATDSAIVMESTGAQLAGDLRIGLPGGTPPGIAGRSPWKTVGPALATHVHGEGRVVQLAAPVDGEYSSPRAMREHRQLLTNCVAYLLRRRQLVIEAPVNVEAVALRRSPGETIVHLIGYWPRKNVKNSWHLPGPSTECMEEPAQYRVRLSFESPVRSARALDPASQVAVQGNTVTAVIARVHEALIVDL